MSSAPAANVGSGPPDGGWGWVVVFGAFISIGFSYAFPKALTVFFKDIQRHFSVNYSDIAWVSSIMLATMYAGGPVSSMLVNRFGSRPVVMLGGLLCGVSMVSASFGSSIIHLYICIGFIGGFGLAFNLNASLTIISKYFLVKRPLANGLAMAGSPVFLCFLAPLNQYLFNHFGWRGSFLILGALLLNCCVAGALMRPIDPPRNYPTASPPSTVDSPNTKLEGSWRRNVSKFLDVSLFKDRGFIIYLVGNVMFFFGTYAPIVFLAAYAVSLGIDEYRAAYLLSIMGFVDMFTRPGTGLVANTKWVRPRVQYYLSFAVSFTGMCHLLCPLASGYAGLVVYTAFFGFGFGMMFALIFECLMDLMGPQRFPSAVGLVTIFECAPMLLGPPMAGALVDIFGDYKYLFIMCGSVMVTAGLFLFVMNVFNYRRLDRKRALEGHNHLNQGQADDLQKRASELLLEERHQSPEAAVEQTEPKATEETAAQGDPSPNSSSP